MQNSIQKPRLTFWQLWNMSFGFFGIQFGFALQNANTSRIFSTLGASPDDLPLFWLAAPVTGLLVQPVIGYLSDHTWHPRWGRRRPFFFFGALLASIAMFLMPNASAVWMAVLVLWMMDAAINVSMEPFRAFVGDKLDSSQQTAGYAMQTFFIGCGAVIASLLPEFFTEVMHVSNVPVNGGIPDSVRFAFYTGGAIYFSAVMWTVLTSQEAPPADMQAFERNRQQAGSVSHAVKEIVAGLLSMPKLMRQLAVVQFFTWIALFAMWIYTTKAVTGHVFGTNDTTSKIYNDAADWVSVMFTVYNGVAAAVAFLLPVLAKRTSNKFTHMLALIAGGLGLISVYFLSDKVGLLLAMVGVGIAWASILSIPYAMLSGSLPSSKMGYYMGVFNFFIVIPQIVAGTILGFLVNTFFNDEPIYALIIGGISMILAGLLTLSVSTNKKIDIND